MRLAIDSNVIIPLLMATEATDAVSRTLAGFGSATRFIVCAPVVAEAAAWERFDCDRIESFLRNAGIVTEWELDRRVWCHASLLFREYSDRRAAAGLKFPRRMLTDFLIAAHALRHADGLVTNDRGYRAISPELALFP